MENNSSSNKEVEQTPFQKAAVRNGLRGKKFGHLGKQSGARGKVFGKQDGRPSDASCSVNFKNIIVYLKSSETNPEYPFSIRGNREKRRSLKRCKQFCLEGD